MFISWYLAFTVATAVPINSMFHAWWPVLRKAYGYIVPGSTKYHIYVILPRLRFASDAVLECTTMLILLTSRTPY